MNMTTQPQVENCALLGYYAAISDNFLLPYRDNLSVLSSGQSSTYRQNQDYVKGAEILGGLSGCQSVKKEPVSVDYIG